MYETDKIVQIIDRLSFKEKKRCVAMIHELYEKKKQDPKSLQLQNWLNEQGYLFEQEYAIQPCHTPAF